MTLELIKWKTTATKHKRAWKNWFAGPEIAPFGFDTGLVIWHRNPKKYHVEHVQMIAVLWFLGKHVVDPAKMQSDPRFNVHELWCCVLDPTIHWLPGQNRLQLKSATRRRQSSGCFETLERMIHWCPHCLRSPLIPSDSQVSIEPLSENGVSNLQPQLPLKNLP